MRRPLSFKGHPICGVAHCQICTKRCYADPDEHFFSKGLDTYCTCRAFKSSLDLYEAKKRPTGFITPPVITDEEIEALENTPVKTLAEAEMDHILSILAQFKGNRLWVSQLLGISVRTLRTKLYL